MPKKNQPGAVALALLYLRSFHGWSQKDLADRLGMKDFKLLSRYESGIRELSRPTLDRFAAAARQPPEAVDLLLLVHRVLTSTSGLPRNKASVLSRAVLAAMTAGAEAARRTLAAASQEVEAKAAEETAARLWERLKRYAPEERRELVGAFPAFRSWALAVRICEASIRAAANRPEEALDLAELAVEIARRIPGDPGWRSRVEGYCWAHVGNARRVANDHARANAGFNRAWALWRAGGSSSLDSRIPEWQMQSLEASLRRAEGRFPEALQLLAEARAGADEEPKATARILLKKEHILALTGDLEGAFASLHEAAPLVKASGDNRLLLALQFKMANNLLQLGNVRQAADLLTEIRELVVRQAKEMDLIRVTWLEGRIKASQGKPGEAMRAFEQVSHYFTSLEMPYDAALASMDLAIVYLKEARNREVMHLALALNWIFEHQGVAPEALASLALFREAALREAATVELARQTILEIEAARRSNPTPRRPLRKRK